MRIEKLSEDEITSETEKYKSLVDFYMCDHEVTQAEYETYCKYGTLPSTEHGMGASYPVYYVSWYDVAAYCNLRSISEGLEPVYSRNGITNPKNWDYLNGDATKTLSCDNNKNGYRLPTSLEWLYAASGGKIGLQGTQTIYSGQMILMKSDIQAIVLIQLTK